MLDKFLAVSYSADQKKTASRQLVDKLKQFPLEELKKLASGDETCKLAYAVDDMKSAGDFCWLDKYKGTPLFSKAVEIEKQLLQLDMEEQQQREAERAARPQPSDVWARRDALCLQKRMLDLDLVMAQNGGDPAAPEAKEEQAIGELEEAQAQEALEGGGGDAAHEQQEDAAIQQLQAAHAGGEGAEGDAPPQEQKVPPKPKAPPQQQAQGGEEEGDEETPKKPKGMSVEVKQSSAKTAGVWEGRSNAGVAPGTNVPVQQAGGNRQGAGAGDDMPTMAAEKMASIAVSAGAFLAKTAKELTMNAREHIADKNFAEPKADGPGDTGKYPIPDKAHAKSALGLVGMHGSSSEQAKVRAAVAKKFPGLEKKANPEGHQLRRALLGNPLSSAIEARPGQRIDAYGEARGHQIAETLKGGLKGGLIGAGLGGAAGLASALLNKGGPAKALGYGLGLGGYAGAGLGGLYGAVKGTHGAEASRIHGARSKHNPEEKTAGVIGTVMNAAKPLAAQAGNVLGAGKSLATSAYAKGGLGQVASSFGNVAKNFAQKNPLTAAGIAGAGGLAAGKMLSNSQPQR